MDRELGREKESVILLGVEEDDLMVDGTVREVDISDSSRMNVPLFLML